MKKLMACIIVLLSVNGHTAPERSAVHLIGIMGDRGIFRVDGQQVLIKKGETKDGLTLIDLNKQSATVKAGTMQWQVNLGMDVGSAIGSKESNRVSVIRNSQGQYIVQGMINKKTAQFLVDTGANTMFLSRYDADRLGVNYLDGQQGQAMTAGGITNVYRVYLNTVQIAGILMNNVEAVVGDAHVNAPILLGMSFLSKVKMQQEGNALTLIGP